MYLSLSVIILTTNTHTTLGLVQPACQLLHIRLANLMLGMIIMTCHCAENEVVYQNSMRVTIYSSYYSNAQILV